MAVTYEWLVDFVDEDGDIIDVYHADTYAEALKWAQDSDFLQSREFHHADIGLVRDVGNDLEGITDRQWAYIEDGKLPERMDWGGGETGGAKVPQRFHKELA